MTVDIKRDFPIEHSRLGPSSAERWMACPGSATLVEQVPAGEEKEYQHEGNMAHALADYCLKERISPTSEYADVFTYGGEPYTGEMREAVGLFYDTVMSVYEALREQGGDAVTIWTETRVTLEKLNPPEPMYGTADAIIVAPGYLHVFDLKYGRGVTVHATTPQVGYYALGAMLQFAAMPIDATPREALDHALAQFKQVHVTIVQPRQGDAVRTETMQQDYDSDTIDVGESYLAQFATVLLMAAERAHAEGASLIAGEQCRLCPAKAFCPALKEYAVGTLVKARVSTVGPPDVATLSLDQAAEYLTKVPVLQAWAKALQERVDVALRAGETVPGFKLVEKRARREWLPGAEEAKPVLKLGQEAYEEPELKSPAQMEKMLGKKQFAATMGELVIKRSTGTTVVPDSDPRPAVGRLSASDDFAGLLPSGDKDEEM